MSQSMRALLVCLPLLIIWLIANFVMTHLVESDLTARASAAVDPILNKHLVTIAGRDAALVGIAYNPQGDSDAVSAVRGTSGVRLVNHNITQLRTNRPYTFDAKREGDKLILSGTVPLPAVRAKIVEVAKSSAPGIAVIDQMTYAQGSPDGFETMVAYGLTEAGKLSGGEISLSNNAYSIAGRASSGAVYRAALAATRQLPAGATVNKVAITSDEISPYVFNAAKADGLIKLTGYYPDEQTHRELLAAVSRRFFNSKLDDQLALGKGAPKDFGGAASAMLLQLSRLDSGTGTMTDMDVSVKGDALYAKAAADIPAELKGAVPHDYNASATIDVAAPSSPLTPATCQPLFADILVQGQILFDTGQASIQSDSAAILDNLSATAMRCPDAVIEISGHTDSVGNDDTNLQLSQTRAEEVSEYLKKAGVGVERMTAVGYGKTRPVASNDTEEGRARNRRIEFDVK